MIYSKLFSELQIQRCLWLFQKRKRKKQIPQLCETEHQRDGLPSVYDENIFRDNEHIRSVITELLFFLQFQFSDYLF